MNCIKFILDLWCRDEVITNPEITKKISTPKYPLGIKFLLKWLIITVIIAKALIPSNSLKYGLFIDLLFLSEESDTKKFEFELPYYIYLYIVNKLIIDWENHFINFII